MGRKKNISRFNERFIKNYNEDSDRGYFLEVDVDFPKILFNSHEDLPFLPKREKLEKVEKLVCSIEGKEKYVIHIRLNLGLKLKKVYRVIQFNQREWLKTYIDMNTKKRREAENEFEKDFFKLMNNSVFGITMENVRKHRDIKLVTTDKRRNKLVSEPNYHTTKHFSENLLVMEMKKKNKNKNDANDVKRWFSTSNYDKNDERPLPIGENKKLLGFFKDELGWKIMIEVCVLRSKTVMIMACTQKKLIRLR